MADPDEMGPPLVYEVHTCMRVWPRCSAVALGAFSGDELLYTIGGLGFTPPMVAEMPCPQRLAVISNASLVSLDRRLACRSDDIVDRAYSRVG